MSRPTLKTLPLRKRNAQHKGKVEILVLKQMLPRRKRAFETILSSMTFKNRLYWLRNVAPSDFIVPYCPASSAPRCAGVLISIINLALLKEKSHLYSLNMHYFFLPGILMLFFVKGHGLIMRMSPKNLATFDTSNESKSLFSAPKFILLK